MDRPAEQTREYVKRLLMSRMRILFTNGFYGLLLMHMEFAIDTRVKTACTDGRKIYFGPSFLSNLTDDELDFVMMHEVMHCALQHCFRGKDLDNEGFNIACDIVVNSNILASRNGNLKYITLAKYGEAMHKTPLGDEGCYYTAEQVYGMLSPWKKRKKKNGPTWTIKRGPDRLDSHMKGAGDDDKGDADGDWDDHSRWGTAGDEDVLRDEWSSRLINAAEAISVRQSATGQGMLPVCAERLLKELRKPQTDWRTILNVFVQEEITDYSFTPPDRRFDGGDFYLPDYNEKDEAVKDILFMVDTSGSMSDDQITAAYSEIKGAIDQFGGRLRGWLGFFDAEIVEPKPFDSIDTFKTIRPYGGGGTRFDIIFDYVREKMDPMPVSIIIMTDGYATFPKESAAMGIPVLWLLVNEGSGEPVNPPWGKVARVEV